MTNETVNHPKHYVRNSIECIDAMQECFGVEEVQSFCKLNAFKYLWRCENKSNMKEDIEKARWYLNKYLELEEKKE